jgi:DTW domain-containing protein YfiP
LLPAQRCLCTDKPGVAAKAVFWLLTHHDEFYKPSNTGRLIVDAIHGSKTFEWSRTEPDPDFIALLSDARYRPYLVFPKRQIISKEWWMLKLFSSQMSIFLPLLFWTGLGDKLAVCSV